MKLLALVVFSFGCANGGGGTTGGLTWHSGIEREVVSCEEEASLHEAGEFSYAVCALVRTCEACEETCGSACVYERAGDTGMGRYTCGDEDHRPGAHRGECYDSGYP